MSTRIEQTDNFPQRVTKLLPADVTAALIAIKSGVSSGAHSGDLVVYGGIAIAIVSPFYFFFVIGTRNLLHIVFLVLSFLVLFLSIAPVEIGNAFPEIRFSIERMIVILTPIWVFLITPIFAQILGKELVG